jgi:hypothetical protein
LGLLLLGLLLQRLWLLLLVLKRWLLLWLLLRWHRVLLRRVDTLCICGGTGVGTCGPRSLWVAGAAATASAAGAEAVTGGALLKRVRGRVHRLLLLKLWLLLLLEL